MTIGYQVSVLTRLFGSVGFLRLRYSNPTPKQASGVCQAPEPDRPSVYFPWS